MPKKLLLLLLLPLLLLSLLLTAVYLMAPTLSRIALERWITSQGFESADISLQHPSAGLIDINNITLTRTDGQRRIRLQASDIQLRFNLRSLLTSARLEAVHIQQLSADILIDSTLPERLQTLQEELIDLDPDLAAELFDLLPAETLSIAELALSYQTDEGPLLEGLGELTLDDQRLDIHLSLQHDQQRLGDIQATLHRDLSIHLQIQEQRLLYEVNGHLAFRDNFWHLHLGHQLQLGALMDWLYRHQFKLPLAIQLPADDQLAFFSRLRLPRLLSLTPSQLLASLEGDLSLSAQLHPSLEQTLAKQISLNIDAQLSLQQNTFNLTLIEGSRLTLHQVSTGDISANRLLLQLIGNTVLSGQLDQPDNWQYGSANWVINGEGLRHQALERFNLLPLQLQLTAGQSGQALRGDLTMPLIAIQPAGMTLPEAGFQGQFSVPADFSHIALAGSLDSEQLPASIDTQARLNKDLRGEVNWTLANTSAPALINALRPFIEAIPTALTVSSGQFNAKGQLGLHQSDWSLQANLGLTSADLLYGNNPIEQLHWTSTLQLDSKGKLQNSGELRTGNINIGFPLQPSPLSYQLTYDTEMALTTSSFTVSLLGGQIYLPSLTFNPLKPDIIFLISLRDLNLGSILELYAEKGLYGEGLIDGQLPIQISPEGIRVEGGNVGTVQPGLIRYQPDDNLDAMAASNLGLRIALEALSNLNYQLLDMQVDYYPNGDLLLKTRLQGDNPEWQQGRPIDLTLTIEDNIPALLKALQITGRIRDAVDSHFQR